MPDLDEAARYVAAHPLRPPTPLGVLSERVRVRRRRRRVVTVAAALVAVAGASAALTAQLRGPSSHPVAVSPAGGNVPPSFEPVHYGRVTIAVPIGWTVVTVVSVTCPLRQEVLLGGFPLPSCASTDSGPVSYVRLAPGAEALPGGQHITIDGHAAVRTSPRGGNYQEVTIPDLNTTLTVYGTPASLTPTILGSLSVSAP